MNSTVFLICSNTRAPKILLYAFLMLPMVCSGQIKSNDGILRIDTLNLDTQGMMLLSTEIEHSPQRAAMYSAVLPGLGQAYNKKYWKIPIIYGGFVGLGYSVDYYNKFYNGYRIDISNKLDSDATNDSPTSLDILRQQRDKSERFRDLNVIFIALLYLLNVADATVDAHLMDWDINPDLNASIEPMIFQEQNLLGSISTGVSLKIRFK